MRSELTKTSNKIIKRVKAAPILFDSLRLNLELYREWLHAAGFQTPSTNLQYVNGQILFEQQLLDYERSTDIKYVIDAICKLKFDTFGLDSNPDNFLGKNEIHFVDFFPFLIHNHEVLQEQFDYDVNTVLKRYFALENILIFYIVRLFKEDPVRALEALKYSKKTILLLYETILPREKVRLLRALQLEDEDKISDFSQIYIKTKKITSISKIKDKELYKKIDAI